MRAANSGISAVVDPLGRIVKSLPLGSQGVLEAALPQPIGLTPYARFGDGPAGAMIGIAFLWVISSRRKESR